MADQPWKPLPSDRNGHWKWCVRAFYNDTVRPPKQPGELAVEVVLANDATRDIEVKAAESRDDIGLVLTYRLGGMHYV